jgi:hypothetical protein
MARVPVVGTQGLHTAQLSPEVRRILHRRAVKANRREYAPVLNADRQALGGINREYQNEASSVRGAASMTEAMLAQALAGLKASGLHGSYLKQATEELTSRQGDAAAAIPFLLSDAREGRTKAIGEAKQQLVQDRASMLKGTAADFNQLLKEGRSTASQILKEQQEKRESEAENHGGEPKFDAKDLQNARLALKDALRTWSENPLVEGPEGSEVHLQQLNPLKTREDWLRFATGLDHQYSGFGLAEINHVIQQLLTDRQRKEHEGRLPQPGVPGPGRG